MLKAKSFSQGFTLIELLIALGVMAVFALMAYRGLDSVLRLHQGAYAHEQQAQAIDKVITQFEADVRQASSVSAALAQGSGGNTGEPRVRIELNRRIDGQASAVVWDWQGNQLSRRVLANRETSEQNKPEQIATLLSGVSALAWLSHQAEQEGKPAQWVLIATDRLLASPTKNAPLVKGVGLRFTIAGLAVEKVFLIGR